MPLYEYRCESCQKVHEVMQKFSDAPLTECPECKSPVTKLMSMSSFALKGSGWYTTDYKRKSSVSKESSEPAKETAPKEATAASEVKNASKPADTPSSGSNTPTS